MSPGARLILELLDNVVPASHRGNRVVDLALRSAGLSAIPETTVELKAFVQTSLRAILEEELGTALAREVSADLENALSPALQRCETSPAVPSSKRRISPPPPSRRGQGVSVVVCSADRLANASLARALLAEGFDVATAHDNSELASLTDRPPHAVVVDERCALEHPDSLEELIASAPGMAVLAHNCSNPAITDALLRAHGAGRMAALPSGATTREVIYALSVLAPSASA